MKNISRQLITETTLCAKSEKLFTSNTFYGYLLKKINDESTVVFF